MNFTAGDRTYTIRIDWAAMKRAKAAGVDLSLTEELLGDFFRGSPLLAEALWAICKPQAGGLTQEQFEAPRRGQVLADAIDALVAGLVDFFPQQRGKAREAAVRQVKEQIEALLSGSIDSREKLESAQTNTPSES